MDLNIYTQLRDFDQEAAGVILSNPMAGTKYFIPIGQMFYTVISVPPGNIHEFNANFYKKYDSVSIIYGLLINGWKLEKAKTNCLREYVIQVIEQDEIRIAYILESFVCKRITKIFDSYPSFKDVSSIRKNTKELDELIDLRILLQNREKLRPKLLNFAQYTGAAPIEK